MIVSRSLGVLTPLSKLDRIFVTQLTGDMGSSNKEDFCAIPPRSGLRLSDFGMLTSNFGMRNFSGLHRLAWLSWCEGKDLDLKEHLEDFGKDNFQIDEMLHGIRRLWEEWELKATNILAKVPSPHIAFMGAKRKEDLFADFPQVVSDHDRTLLVSGLAAQVLEARWPLHANTTVQLVLAEPSDDIKILEAVHILRLESGGGVPLNSFVEMARLTLNPS